MTKKENIVINLKTKIDGYNQEKLEDKLKELLEKNNIEANILNEFTGNEVSTNPTTKGGDKK